MFGHWLPFLNMLVMTSAQGLLAAHPAGQACGAQSGFVGRMVSAVLSAQALALSRRPLVRHGVDLGSGSRSRGQVPGWEMTVVRPGGGWLLLSWLSLGVTSGPWGCAPPGAATKLCPQQGSAGAQGLLGPGPVQRAGGSGRSERNPRVTDSITRVKSF